MGFESELLRETLGIAVKLGEKIAGRHLRIRVTDENGNMILDDTGWWRSTPKQIEELLRQREIENETVV